MQRLSSTKHFLTVNVPAPADATELLRALAVHRAKATFFVTVGAARANGGGLRELLSSGHEIAAAVDAGPAASTTSWDAYRRCVAETKRELEDIAQVRVSGYRDLGGYSPSEREWRLDMLIEEGFEYDSSRMSRVRIDDKDPRVHYARTVLCRSGSIVEIPAARAFELGREPRVDAWIGIERTRRMLRTHARGGLFGVAELTLIPSHREGSPRSRSIASAAGRFVTPNTAKRLDRLLAEFRFDAIGHRLPELSRSAPATFAA
jgi:peptidoglycan/xylan/chitin deacetylase (PgdA/CDA1 family)